MNEFDSSAIALSVNEIIDNSAENKPDEKWEFEFILDPEAPVDLTDPDLAVTEDEIQGIYKPVVFLNLDFQGNFEKNFCDYVNAEVVVGAGTWLKVLYPARSYMKVSLRRVKADRQGGSAEIEGQLAYTFKPIFKESQAGGNISETAGISRLELDTRDIVKISVDLLEPSAEAVQSAPCGGTWRNTTAMDVLRFVFADVCSQFTFEGEPLVNYYRVSEGFNDKKRTQISIAAGLMLTDLPAVLHEHHGGIWPTGIARYLRGNTWFIYPPYDTTRVDKERKTLTIVTAPERLFTGVNRTWFLDGDHLKLIATGEINIKDPTQEKFLLTGNGARFASASSVLDGSWMETKGNKAIAKRSKNLSEVRIDAPGYTDIRIQNSAQSFTDNTMYQLSALAGKKGTLVSLTWNYADHTQIEPGMPCRILYERDKELMEVKGNVVGYHAAVQSTQKASLEGTFMTTCALFVFCQTPELAQ